MTAPVATLVGGVPRIGLADLPAEAALLTRVDHKYLVPLPRLADVLAALPPFAVLSVAATCASRYDSTYFDDAHLSLFRAHRQGRRRRYKVRTRSYLDTADCLVEVKLAGSGGATVKERMPYDISLSRELIPQARQFVGQVVAREYGTGVPALRAVARTRYRRTTLVCQDAPIRVTCDVGLMLIGTHRQVMARPDLVLVETKSQRGADAELIRALRRRGIRPLSISKYCLAVASLYQGPRVAPWGALLRNYLT